MVTARNLAEAWAARVLGGAETSRPVSIPLSEFKGRVYRHYEHAPHLELLDTYLARVTEYVETRGARGLGKLIIAMPPRHGKTLTVSRLYPVWHLGRNPRHRIMLVSYGQSLANINSRAARNLIRSRAYGEIFPGTRLAADSQSVLEWTIDQTDNEGGATAIGIGGAATGKGSHVLIIDDPIKNRQEAESLTYRERIWQSYTDDLLTRLEPGGAIIVMATRWHEDDLTGRLLKKEGGEWEQLMLPALAEEGDALGRPVGAALWPGRYDEAALAKIQRTQGPYSWASLYQQRPQPAEGGILKKNWFLPAVYQVPGRVVRRVRYWDLAMSEKTSADYTVGLRLDESENGEHYITDVARAQVELHDLPGYIKSVILNDGPDVMQGFEMKGYMTRAVTTLAKDVELRLYTLKGFDVEQDKLTRLLPAAARAALGVIHLVRADWNDALLNEFGAFPNGAHDDQVDAFSGAWRMMSEPEKKPLQATTSRWA